MYEREREEFPLGPTLYKQIVVWHVRSTWMHDNHDDEGMERSTLCKGHLIILTIELRAPKLGKIEPLD